VTKSAIIKEIINFSKDSFLLVHSVVDEPADYKDLSLK